MPDQDYEAPVTEGGGEQGVTQPPSPSGTGATPPPPPSQGGASAAGGGQPPANNGEWIPRTRLNEVTERARYEIGRLRSELQRVAEERKQQTVTPQEADAESDAIKQRFFQLFPAAQKLFSLPADQLEGLLQAGPQFQAQTEHYWTTVGSTYLRQLEQSMQKVYGGTPDARARRWIETAFIDWVQNDDQAKTRYVQQDPNLVADFWQSVDSLMFEPVRRSAIAGEQRRSDRRARLPIPGAGTQALGKGPGAKPKNEDELHERAYEAFEQNR